MNQKDDNKIFHDVNGFSRYLNLMCRVLRTEVRHGIKEKDGIQTIKCFGCGDIYEMHIEGRNRIEKSLWGAFQQFKGTVNLDPLPVKYRPQERWSPKYVILGNPSSVKNRKKDATRESHFKSFLYLSILVLVIIFFTHFIFHIW